METDRNKIKMELIKKIANYEHKTGCIEAWKFDLAQLVKAYVKNM